MDIFIGDGSRTTSCNKALPKEFGMDSGNGEIPGSKNIRLEYPCYDPGRNPDLSGPDPVLRYSHM